MAFVAAAEILIHVLLIWTKHTGLFSCRHGQFVFFLFSPIFSKEVFLPFNGLQNLKYISLVVVYFGLSQLNFVLNSSYLQQTTCKWAKGKLTPSVIIMCVPVRVNTLRLIQMAAISQTTFSSAFSWMKIYNFRLGFHWCLFPRVQLTIFQHWFR